MSRVKTENGSIGRRSHSCRQCLWWEICGGKDVPERWDLSLEWKSEGVMDGESGDTNIYTNKSVCIRTAASKAFLLERDYATFGSLLSRIRLSSVCNFRAPYSRNWSFRQYFYVAVYLGHLLTSLQNFTEIRNHLAISMQSGLVLHRWVEFTIRFDWFFALWPPVEFMLETRKVDNNKIRKTLFVSLHPLYVTVMRYLQVSK